MGLDQVKELTSRTIGRILRERPFHSLDDFLTRANPRKQEAEDLTRIGALEGLGNIPGILTRLQGGGWKPGQMSLFQWDQTEGEDWSLTQKVDAQQTLLGLSLAAHPLELVDTRGAITSIEALTLPGRRVAVAGIRQGSRRSRTAKGETMMFLTLEDLAGTLDVILFPDVYRRVKAIVGGSAPLLVTGVIERDATREEPFLRAEQVSLLR
jgi:DNA polymerase III alpha subunit